jgi:hypothetical protein
MTCPQCKQPIDGIRTKEYACGWCRLDIHHDCLPLHVRACQACRAHNAEFLAAQSPK